MARAKECPTGGPTKENGNCTNPGPDGLPVQCVGEWAEHDKHEYLRRYIDATREVRRGFLRAGAHGSPGGAGYVDLYAGPGRIRVRDSGEVFDGSPLIALAHDKAPFTKVVLCDLDSENISALRSRTAAHAKRVEILQGDCNRRASDLVNALPKFGLNLAFVDPFHLDHLRFSTLEALARLERMDLVVNFPTQDARRNLALYRLTDNEVLDLAVGSKAWRERVKTPKDIHRAIDVLVEALEALGYTGTHNRTMRYCQ